LAIQIGTQKANDNINQKFDKPAFPDPVGLIFFWSIHIGQKVENFDDFFTNATVKTIIKIF
jgi:hypothetical protein